MRLEFIKVQETNQRLFHLKTVLVRARLSIFFFKIPMSNAEASEHRPRFVKHRDVVQLLGAMAFVSFALIGFDGF